MSEAAVALGAVVGLTLGVLAVITDLPLGPEASALELLEPG